MRIMILLSLIINILILIPVCGGLMSDASWARLSYGEGTAARGILLSVYLAICLTSGLLLFLQNPLMVASLLLVQVVYKVTTPLTVGTLANPVVITNLIVAGFHSITIFLIWRSMRS